MKTIILIALGLLSFTYCAYAVANQIASPSDSPKPPASNNIQQNQNKIPTLAKITVTSSIARRSMNGSPNSAAYISLHNANTQDVVILGVTAVQIANRIEIHTTATDTNGVNKIVRVNRLVVPAQGDLVMSPGGVHIMLLDLKSAMNIGDEITLNLQLEDLGIYPVTVKISEKL